ncbi:hypothetical protein ACFVMC_07710 [Nocardia sp. NPDC127579]|uniref:hypothetical protein n=1 Tax=Nocardia sp. NPDC127579 TaxID=3345402 RepID=UPI0036331AA2
MDRMPVARSLIATFALAIGLTACGGGDRECGGQDSCAPLPTKVLPTPTETDRPAQGTLFTADPTIVGAHPIPFTGWTRLGEDRLAVHFQAGNPACYGVDAVTTETDSTVTIEVRSGTRADAVGRMCTMEVVFGTLEIALEAPLGDRTVLSAA